MAAPYGITTNLSYAPIPAPPGYYPGAYVSADWAHMVTVLLATRYCTPTQVLGWFGIECPNITDTSSERGLHVPSQVDHGTPFFNTNTTVYSTVTSSSIIRRSSRGSRASSRRSSVVWSSLCSRRSSRRGSFRTSSPVETSRGSSSHRSASMSISSIHSCLCDCNRDVCVAARLASAYSTVSDHTLSDDDCVVVCEVVKLE